MNKYKNKRSFNHLMRDSNSAFLSLQGENDQPTRVAFVLLEHFSMMAFTAAVDALVTANLVRSFAQFSFSTFSLNGQAVKSDLSIDINTNGGLDKLAIEGENAADIIIVCGGYRCSLNQHSVLSAKLKAAAKRDITLGGLWNGAIALANAGLLDNQECALHPDNHAFMQERFNRVKISKQTHIIDDKHATSAGPISALEMMLSLIEKKQGRDIVRAIREILSCDQVTENSSSTLTINTDNQNYPETLRTLLQLMNSNIEEPLGINDLATYAGVSRRRVERLFQSHLETTPSRYYLELRITNARRLLLQGEDSIANIASACGFLSSTHFSHCFKEYFGISPSQARQSYAS
ncbi:GlxA family transcriptional regulator [Dasania sp. GY-MA-18]|uniref:GlxA family transcriptional regulator n=1 Tax=Dasania phycosphaerae TaxID=2950436 RepID=A0A9J6RP24_9GAMM|nr:MULTISPECIES: GlxA family transcriptional regulator [Dasania]MCR8923502.1 GlxA family transcriptional regulator [Dasania sp. GY-MA-18]MCZ0865936.1 GlxA family transcriptional regulator [Dasania phycosphaerae]MCZ0869660.1 GlxA family transcriptional regulator [Dasania phycosphaerae]